MPDNSSTDTVLQPDSSSVSGQPKRPPFLISASNFFQFARWMLIATITGLVVGSVSTLFNFGLKYAVDFRRSHLWVVLLLPAAGLIIVFCTKRSIMKTMPGPIRSSTASTSRRTSRCG